MLDFIDVKDRIPEDGAEVEVLRGVGAFMSSGYCRYAIERTTVFRGMFYCDMVSTGQVLFWRPADFPGPVVTGNEYPGLRALFDEEEDDAASG